jgi:N-acetylglutamate synthase-like GNAT family acetyltransferase
MTNLITIREFETKDKNEVIDLIRLNTPQYFAVDEEEDLKKYLETERELYYVLLNDQKIVGCGGINFADNNTIGKISWDILHPEYQGKSLGTKLLKHRLDKLNSINGIKKITVRTSQVAYKFYEKQGFELFEIKKDYWAEGFDMYNMVYKKLLKQSSKYKSEPLTTIKTDLSNWINSKLFLYLQNKYLSVFGLKKIAAFHSKNRKQRLIS